MRKAQAGIAKWNLLIGLKSIKKNQNKTKTDIYKQLVTNKKTTLNKKSTNQHSQITKHPQNLPKENNKYVINKWKNKPTKIKQTNNLDQIYLIKKIQQKIISTL